MSNGNQALEDYEPGFNPSNRAIAVLERQRMDNDDLLSHVECAREAIDARRAASFASLLCAIRSELCDCGRLLRERIAFLSHGSTRFQWAQTDSRSFWRLFQTDGSDYAAHLEALLSGYVRYARATADSIAFLELLGDLESVKLLRRISEVADRGIWFIELYMEELALHRGLGDLPEYLPVLSLPATEPGTAAK